MKKPGEPGLGGEARDHVEYDDPTERPGIEELASGPAERAVLGRQGPWGFLALVVAILLFIAIVGTAFYFLT